MKKKFCCEGSRHLYEHYYTNQAGNGISVFQGYRGQRGHGIGSTIMGLFRSAAPMLKRGLAAFGKQALGTGLQIASDMADGSSFSDSAKLRAREGIKRLASEGVDYLNTGQTGSGYSKKRKRLTRKTTTSRAHHSKHSTVNRNRGRKNEKINEIYFHNGIHSPSELRVPEKRIRLIFSPSHSDINRIRGLCRVSSHFSFGWQC